MIAVSEKMPGDPANHCTEIARGTATRLVETAQRAFEAETDKSAVASFDRQFTLELTQIVPDTDIMILQACALRRKAALSHARTGKQHQSARAFLEIRQLQANTRTAPATRTTISSFLASAEAYYHFKFKERGRDTQKLMLSLRLDRILHDRYGLGSIDIHRLQTLSNFARMTKADGRTIETLRLLWQGVAYCLGDETAWPFPGAGLNRTVVRNSAIWTVMARQLWGEFFLVLSDRQPGARRTDMKSFLTDHVIPGQAFLPQEWCAALSAKLALMNGNHSHFLDCTEQAIRPGLHENPLVCLLLLKDAIPIIEQTHPRGAETVSALIDSAETRFQRIPKILTEKAPA